MASSARRLYLVLAIAAALCLAAPLSASAATTRYASPDGTGASPCAATEPCSIEDALSTVGPGGLAEGDTVLLAPGTYEPTAELDVFRVGVIVAGEPGRPRPLIKAVGVRGLYLPNPGEVRDLRIEAGGATSFGLAVVAEGSVVERVESTGEAAGACGLGEDVTMRDSLCASTISNGTGVYWSVGGSATQELNLVNVTAIGTLGIVIQVTETATGTISATNTIAVGEEHDVEARAVTATTSATVTLAHSNFDDTMGVGAGTFAISAPTESGNQEAPPLFVDEAGGDYREQAASPTRLAGDLGTVLPGELDLAGNSRTTNCAGTVGVDIGAYQYECPTPEPPVVVPKDETKPEPLHPCTCALELPPRPGLTKLGLKPARFVDAGKAPKGTARGTTISFTLSATASVKLEVLGKKAVKDKKPKTVLLGTLPPVAGKAGVNHVKFSGKVNGKPLDPGHYTLGAVVTAAGRQSSPVTTSFTVLAPAIP